MRRGLRKVVFVAVALGGLALLVMIYVADARSNAPSLNRVAAWMPTSWDVESARLSWDSHRSHIQELSPVWYQLDAGADGSINPYGGACDAALVAEAHANGTLVLPLVNNSYGGVFDPVPLQTVIHSPTLRSAHVVALVNEVMACGTDGIDIDYERLGGTVDREPFSLFVEELAVALHGEGKLLSVTVSPKTSDVTWGNPGAQDWSRIGAVADRVRIMTYGYHWSSSSPGPIAPVFWMEDVASYAVQQISSNKVYLGLHFYGLDWGDGPAGALTWESVQDLLVATSSSRQWAATDDFGRSIGEPWFTYTVDSVQHEVWYADGGSIAARLPLVKEYGLGGIAVWRLGREDPVNWTVIAVRLHPAQFIYLPVVLSIP
jgi:spore germination protein YaaH